MFKKTNSYKIDLSHTSDLATEENSHS